MNRNVPHQNSFDVAKQMSHYQKWVLGASTFLTIVSIALNAIQQKQHPLIPELDNAIDWVNLLASFFAVGYLVLDILINDRFYNGGKEKRLDLVDHAFDTNFSGERSTGYFNAGSVDKGIYKMAVLVFENSFFTSSIAKKMLRSAWATTIMIAAIFIFSACIGNKMLVNNILQIVATGVLVQQTIRLQQFSNRMGRIHEDFKTLFSDLKGMSDKSLKEGEMIRNILNYESTHSWGNILLDSDIFKKENHNLSQKWETLKKSYCIQ